MIWFGEGDFGKSLNLAASAGDFVDADNIAATAARGRGHARHEALPAGLVSQLADRIVGATLGGVKLTPPVDETISDLARVPRPSGCGCSPPTGPR